jgi:ABC-2 type transport system permease protein
MGAFTGTSRLVRLALRRDRIKLPATVLGLGFIFISLVASVAGTYKTEADYVAYASASVVSAVARAFNGPVMGASFGSVAFTETFTFFSIFTALVTTLLVIRHTRQNEETGRAELVGAAVVGRFAPLTAALLVALAVNVLLGIFTALGFLLYGLPADSSLLAGIAMAMIGIAFGGIAAVAAQLMSSARAANGLAAASIGVAFLVRAIGDMQGKVEAGGLSAVSGWLSWLSPIGIARNARPFADDYWWVITPLAVLCVALVMAAFWLLAHRDIGAGLLAARPGPATAKPDLLSSFGLAWRLQRGLLLGWAVALVVLGVALGAVGNEVASFVSASDESAELIATLGGTDNLVDAYMAFSLMFLGVGVAAYAIQSLLRMRSEETSGHLELVLAAEVGKKQWLLSHLGVVVAGALLLLAAGGAAAGLAYGIAIDDVWGQLATMVGAMLAYLPSVLLFCGLTVAAFGLLPSWSIATSWLAFGLAYLIVQFGPLLKLPGWVTNLSPFTHTPRLPASELTLLPLVVLTGVALVIILLGLWGFRRRNLSMS